MVEKTTKTAYDNAVKALKKIPQRDIQELTPFDFVATLDALADVSELTDLRVLLASRIEEYVNVEWVKTAPLFDVFSALIALYAYEPAKVSGENLAAAIERLVQCEVAIGGPYTDGSESNIIANAQIARFLQMVAKPLPNVDAFLENAVKEVSFQDILVQPYCLYLFLKAQPSADTQKQIADHLRGDLRTLGRPSMALAVCSEMVSKNQGVQGLEVIIAEQLPNGFWKREVLARGMSSKITTTSLVVGLLAKFQAETVVDYSRIQGIHNSVTSETMRLCGGLAGPVRSLALTCVGKVCHPDRGFEITSLAYIFASALKVPPNVLNRQYAQLGVASVFGWTAYTIYDDFLDNEGDPAKLPLANIAMRMSLDCFRKALPTQRAFIRYVARVFTAIDEANAWEVAYCRFEVKAGTILIDKIPAYGSRAVLAARSFGHALAPMAILAVSTQRTSMKKRYVERGFSHFLIAKQLRDDMHDWHKDMRTGQVSYVVACILRDMKVRSGEYDLDALLLQMQKQFKQKTLPKICEIIIKHMELSRRNLERSQLFTDRNELYSLLDELKRSSCESLDVYEKAKAMLAIRV